MSNRIIALCGALALTGALATSANAIILNPGDSGTVDGFALGSVGVDYNILAQNSQDITGVNALGHVRFTGILETFVLQETATGDLDFVYDYYNNPNSIDSPSRVTVTGFQGWTTNVQYITDHEPSNLASTFIQPHTANRSNDGDEIGFTFDTVANGGYGLIAPNTVSMYMAVRTNATAFTDQGTTSIIDGAVGTVQTYSPVPEPASIAVLGLGALGLLVRRRRS